MQFLTWVAGHIQVHAKPSSDHHYAHSRSEARASVSHSVVSDFWPHEFSLPGSSVHGILQARILEWVAISFSSVTSLSRDWTPVSCTAGRFFTIWVPEEGKSPNCYLCVFCLIGVGSGSWSPFTGGKGGMWEETLMSPLLAKVEQNHALVMQGLWTTKEADRTMPFKSLLSPRLSFRMF